MGTQLGAKISHPQLRGSISLSREAELRLNSSRVKASGLFAEAAAYGGNLLKISDVFDVEGMEGALAVCTPKNNAPYFVTIGLPRRAGRRFRFVLGAELDHASEQITFYTSSRLTGAAWNVMSGDVMSGDVGGGVILRNFRDRRFFRFEGSATANNRPAKGNFVEFLDAGDHWYFNGLISSRNGGLGSGV